MRPLHRIPGSEAGIVWHTVRLGIWLSPRRRKVCAVRDGIGSAGNGDRWIGGRERRSHSGRRGGIVPFAILGLRKSIGRIRKFRGRPTGRRARLGLIFAELMHRLLVFLRRVYSYPKVDRWLWSAYGLWHALVVREGEAPHLTNNLVRDAGMIVMVVVVVVVTVRACLLFRLVERRFRVATLRRVVRMRETTTTSIVSPVTTARRIAVTKLDSDSPPIVNAVVLSWYKYGKKYGDERRSPTSSKMARAGDSVLLNLTNAKAARADSTTQDE